MDYVELVLKALKLEAKALGFNEKELKSVAAIGANNLGLSENSTEEEVSAAIDKCVKEVLVPILKSSQSASSRAIEAYKAAHPETTPTPPKGEGEEKKDEKPQWAIELEERIKALQTENTNFKEERTSTSYKERLNEVLKDTGRFGDSILKAFGRMKFASEEEFGEYLSQVKEDVKGYKQDLANHGLETLSNPPAPAVPDDEKKLTDAEIDELAGLYQQ